MVSLGAAQDQHRIPRFVGGEFLRPVVALGMLPVVGRKVREDVNLLLPMLRMADCLGQWINQPERIGDAVADKDETLPRMLPRLHRRPIYREHDCGDQFLHGLLSLFSL